MTASAASFRVLIYGSIKRNSKGKQRNDLPTGDATKTRGNPRISTDIANITLKHA